MSGGVYVTKQQQSFTGNAIVATTYADDYVTRGQAFQVQKRFSLTSGASAYWEFNVPAAASKIVYSLPIAANTYGGGCSLDTYYADSSTGGSAVTPINLNAGSSINPLVTVKSGVTVSGTPTGVREYLIGSSASARTGGGTIGTDVPKIIATDKPLYFKFTNLENSTIQVAFNFVWYELNR